MKTKLPNLALVALCLLFGGVALAAGTADDLIKSRQDAMKGNAEALRRQRSQIRILSGAPIFSMT